MELKTFIEIPPWEWPEDAELNDGVENKKMRTSFHTLRHTYASRMVQAGVDLYRVQRLLGHSNRPVQ